MLFDFLNPDEPAWIAYGLSATLTDQFWKIFWMGSEVRLRSPILPTKAQSNQFHRPQKFQKAFHRSIICLTLATIASGLILASATQTLAVEQGFPATHGSVLAW